MKFFVKYIFCLLISTKVFSNEIFPKIPQPTIAFKENKGQVSDQFYKPRPDVLFSGTDGQLNFHLKTNGISYQLSRVDSWKKDNSPKKGALLKDKEAELVPDQLTLYRLDINWPGANEHTSIKKGEALEGYDNYYTEVCPNGALDVKSYKHITYQNIYKGIDLKWYEKNGHLKYDYIVSAGSDYKEIQLQINGAEKISLNKKGELIIKTPLGEIIEQAPYVTQKGKQLKAKWLVKNNVVSFDIKNSDPTQTLIIDPLIRLWGTYYGGADSDVSYYTTTDLSNNVYITGVSLSNNNIATTGAYQNTIGGNNDAFLVKFDANGIRQWATYYGGSGIDYSSFCIVDVNGNIVIGGGTYSSQAIATPGSHQPIASGGGCPAGFAPDAFLAKFNSSGIRQWGTYYGGTACEWASGAAMDQVGNIYMIGATSSLNGNSIATVGSYQPSFSGGTTDGYLVKFDPAGTRLWGTYYGGNTTQWDAVVNCAVDQIGNVYVVGFTDQNGGSSIATAVGHQPTFGGGICDAYLAKFSAAGLRVWGTYYGGLGQDEVVGCTINNNNLYISGRTNSSNGLSIATASSHQPFIGGNFDSFLASFDLSGNRQWATYYGGSGREGQAVCASDIIGNVYLSGFTTSSGGLAIATPCAYQYNYAGSTDSYLAKFTSGGTRLYGTYYGGTGTEDYSYCATDNIGNVYLTGETSTSTGTVIASSGSHQSNYGGGSNDGFLVKFDGCIPVAPPNTTPPPNQTVCYSNATILSTSLSCGVQWYNDSTKTTLIGVGSNYSTPTLTSNTTFYIGELSCGPNTLVTTVIVTVTPLPTLTVTAMPPVICAGQSATLSSSNASSYSWSPTGNLNSVSVNSVIANPGISTTYSVKGYSGLCIGSGTVFVQVMPTPTLDILSTNHFICIGTAIPMSVTGAQNYTWSPSSSLTSPTGSLVYASPQVSTTYTVLGSTMSGTVSCTSQNTYYVQALVTPQATVGANIIVCEGDEAVLFVNGGNTYEWFPSFNSSDPTKNYVYVKPLVNTIYTVNVSNDGYCITTKTVAVTVNPKPTVFAGRDTVFNLNEPMYLTATGTGSLTWIEGEVYCNDCIRTQIFPARYSCYVLQAINEFGCEAKDEVCVDIGIANGLYVPNSFTPNNDGLNDVLYVYGFGITKMYLEIFDRWGNKLFKSSDQTTGWNGTFNGSACKEEVYVYRLEYRLNDYKSAVLTGHINLLR